MNLIFEAATEQHAGALAALHRAVAEDLTEKFGRGPWSAFPTVGEILDQIRRPDHEQILLARNPPNLVVAAVRLASEKPSEIDPAHFSASKSPLYLTAMAVQPEYQRQGIGRRLLKEADTMARSWPADAIRLDAYDAQAGAGAFYAKCGFREVGRAVFIGNPLIYFESILFDWHIEHW